MAYWQWKSNKCLEGPMAGWNQPKSKPKFGRYKSQSFPVNKQPEAMEPNNPTTILPKTYY